MGTIITIIIVLLKFFSVIDIAWIIVILFAIVLILMDLSIPKLNDVASANYIGILSNEIDDLKEQVNDFKEDIEELKQQIDSLESEVNDAKPSSRNYEYDWS